MGSQLSCQYRHFVCGNARACRRAHGHSAKAGETWWAQHGAAHTDDGSSGTDLCRSFEELKKIEDFIALYAEVPRRLPGAEIWFVGLGTEGPYRDCLQQMQARLGHLSALASDIWHR